MAQSWKEWSGRQRGRDGYAIGDLTRGALRAAESKFCSDSSRSLGSDARPSDIGGNPALNGAVTGLQALRAGLKTLGELGLPHGVNALEKIRLGIEELEAQLEEVMAYQQQHPESGTLLQVQVCSASGSEDPPEWSMGKLYTSTEGLFFESSEVPPWHIGPLRWSDITSLKKFQGGDVRLEVVGADKVHVLAGISNLDVLEKLGGLTNESLADNRVSDAPLSFSQKMRQFMKLGSQKSIHTDDQTGDASQSAPEAPTDDRAQDASPSCAPEAWFDQYGASPTSSKASPAAGIGSLPTDSTMSFMPVAEELPDEVPTDTQALFQMSMPRATIEGIHKVLEINSEWPLRLFLEQHLKATDVHETSWVRSQRIPGTVMRRLRFRMPVPADVPKAVKRLVKLPETTQVTLLARMGCSANKITLVQEVCSHDVTYGEDFWAQDVLTFTSCSEPAGGVLFEKFATIRWVTALPWYAGVLGTFIEMKAKEDSKTAGVSFAKYLETNHGM